MTKIPKDIIEFKGVIQYLTTRGILKQFQKTKQYLLSGNISQTKFEQFSNGFWYFRINRKYRAIGKFNNEGEFIVLEVRDHQ